MAVGQKLSVSSLYSTKTVTEWKTNIMFHHGVGHSTKLGPLVGKQVVHAFLVVIASFVTVIRLAQASSGSRSPGYTMEEFANRFLMI